jgi:hypothetical protein
VWKQIKEGLPSFVGWVAEQVCHELLIDRNGGELGGAPIEFESLGRWWGPHPGDRSRIEEVDVVATGKAGAIVGEVRWQNKPAGRDDLEALRAKAELVPLPARAPVRLLFVSKGGFTRGFAEALPEGSIMMDGAQFLGAALRAERSG